MPNTHVTHSGDVGGQGCVLRLLHKCLQIIDAVAVAAYAHQLGLPLRQGRMAGAAANLALVDADLAGRKRHGTQ